MFTSSFVQKSSNDKPFFYLKYSEYMAIAFNEFLSSPSYEAQFLRNFELVLKKHKKHLLPILNIKYLFQCYFSKQRR